MTAPVSLLFSCTSVKKQCNKCPQPLCPPVPAACSCSPAIPAGLLDSHLQSPCTGGGFQILRLHLRDSLWSKHCHVGLARWF